MNIRIHIYLCCLQVMLNAFQGKWKITVTEGEKKKTLNMVLFKIYLKVLLLIAKCNFLKQHQEKRSPK